MRLMRTVILGLMLLVCASATIAQDVKVQSNPNTDFSKFKTFSWIPGSTARNPLVHQMVVQNVEQQLTARGLTRKDADGDLQISYLAATNMDLQVAQPSWNYAAGTALSTGIATLGAPYEVHRGTLLIDLIDRTSTYMVWRGYATKTLSDGPSGDTVKDAKRVEKTVKQAIAKMFKKYPGQKPA
jgi:uncharacterized protein DUF4136